MREFYTLHSVVGGSGAKRWMKCPGSVRMSAGLPDRDPEEFTAEGIVAHEVAAECLSHGRELWEFAGQIREVADFKVEVDAAMISHLQLYMDTIFGELPQGYDGTLMIERQVSYASLGYPQAFGTLDCGLVCAAEVDEVLHIFDLKFGEGLFVSQSDPQFRYYAGAVIATFPELTAGVQRVKIWVVQPRIDWAGPKVRTLELTRDELGEWVHNEMLPAIDRTAELDAPLVPGKEQCQFCPAAATCPAQRKLAAGLLAEVGDDPAAIAEAASDEQIGLWLEKWHTVKGIGKALEREAFNRMQHGRRVPGVKLVESKTHRVGKPGFEAAAVAKWGNRAYKPVTVHSIAQLEKLPGGAKFAQEWGYKPKGAPTLAPLSDNRPEIKGLRTPQNAFAALLTKHEEDE